MRKISIITIITLFMTLCTSCIKADSTKADVHNSHSDEGKISVVTTIFPVYDFVRSIAGDSVNLTLLIKPETDIHSFDPSVSDIKTINECDLFIYIGGKSDSWAERILADKSKSQTNTIRLIDHIQTLDIDNGHGTHETDEHIWTSPANAAVIVGVIADALQVSASEYLSQLQELDDYIYEVVGESNKNKIIVADRFTMRYFTDRYGLEYEAALGACTDHGDVSAAAVVRLVNTVKSENIGYVFYGELSGKHTAKTVSEETGAELLLLHSVQNVSKSEFESGETYLTLMRKNAENLRRGLQ
ncbi:MAG: metal ABC transporter substrate-binding protein [Oscillospiraceae bacterium]|nr:metal ABC transporter substrate-binding protein [Oscillospiraceae bacterium]